MARWLALAGTLPILVLGPAWDDLLWPFQLGFFASMSAGLGALLAFERRDRRGDLVACALLVVAISFSSLGLPFIAGAAVLVGWDRNRLRRAWIVAVPAALYALWWLGWGREADNFVSLHNLATRSATSRTGSRPAWARCSGSDRRATKSSRRRWTGAGRCC